MPHTSNRSTPLHSQSHEVNKGGEGMATVIQQKSGDGYGSGSGDSSGSGDGSGSGYGSGDGSGYGYGDSSGDG